MNKKTYLIVHIEHCEVHVSKNGVKADHVEVDHVDQLATGHDNTLVRLSGGKPCPRPWRKTRSASRASKSTSCTTFPP